MLYADVHEDKEDAFDALFKRSTPLPITNPSKFDRIQYHFAHRSVVKIPLAPNSKVVQTLKNGSVGYALMDRTAGGSLAVPIRLYADCMPSAGVSGPFSCLVFISMLMLFTASSTRPDNFFLKNSNPSVQLTVSNGLATSVLNVQLE